MSNREMQLIEDKANRILKTSGLPGWVYAEMNNIKRIAHTFGATYEDLLERLNSVSELHTPYDD